MIISLIMKIDVDIVADIIAEECVIVKRNVENESDFFMEIVIYI